MVNTLCQNLLFEHIDYCILNAGRQSTTALDRRAIQRNQNTSRSLDLGPVTEHKVQAGCLGMDPELATWWGEQGAAGGMGADPLQGWLGREEEARAVYKR